MDGRGVRQTLEETFRAEGPRVLSTLIRLVGDFDLAEDSMQAAFVAAAESWPRDGIPANPRAWLVSTARFKAVDAIRRNARLFASLHEFARRHGEAVDPFPKFDESNLEDDRLRLIFTCCHPALSNESQTALTLREVCGLTTDEVAHAYLTSPGAIAQRIVRAKARIREQKIAFEVPTADELPGRLNGVLGVAYLMFNEGYYASSGDTLTRQTLSDEAIRLARMVVELAPEPEVYGLLALMLLQESRRRARTSDSGDLILFDDQDPALWDRGMIAEGLESAACAADCPSPGSYALQAAIASAHMEGALAGRKDWARIVGLYDRLLALHDSPVIELNKAIAVAEVEGPAAGLAIVDRLLGQGALEGYAVAHSTRADFCRRLGLFDDAYASYSSAYALTSQAAQRRFLERRMREVSSADPVD